MNAFKILIPLLSLSLAGLVGGEPELSEAAKHAKWKETAIRSIEEVAKNPTWEGVASLTAYYSLAERGDHMEPRHHEVYRLATNTLYSLPDFTNYFRQAIAHYNDLERQWAEEVRSGKRTFRFKGDPTEYNFQGPVRKTLDERTHPDRSPGDTNHPGPSSAAAGDDAVPFDSTPHPFPWLPVSVAGLILLAAIGFVIRGRPRAGRFRKS